MTRGQEPAFPINRPGEGTYLGLTIREYVEVEILGKLSAEWLRAHGKTPPQDIVEKAMELTDAWFLRREKKNGAANVL